MSIEAESVLNREYLSSLETFDIVYFWGVLHHTGAMWHSLENVFPLVRKDNFSSLYTTIRADGSINDGSN